MKLKTLWNNLGGKPKQLAPPVVSTHEEDDDLEYVYTDHTGVRHYRWREGVPAPVTRYLSGLRQVTYVEMGFKDANEAMDYVRVMIAEHNKGDHAGVGYHLKAMFNRMATSDPALVWMQMAAIYTVQDGEDKKFFDPQVAIAKVARWRKIEKEKNFFLSLAYKIGKRLLQNSETDTLTASPLTMMKELTDLLTTLQKQPNGSLTT